MFGAAPSVGEGRLFRQAFLDAIAAGVASLIKVALCLHHGVRPPTLNLQRPNPYWNPETSPFSFRDRSPWYMPRICGIV